MLIIRVLCRTAMFDKDKSFTGYQHSTFTTEVQNEVLLVQIGNIKLHYTAVGGSVETIESKPYLRLHLAATYFATDDFSRSVANTLHKTHVIKQPPRINNGIDLVVPEVYGSEVAEIIPDKEDAVSDN